MSVLVLRLERPPALRVDVRGIDVAALALLPAIDVARVGLRVGNETAELGTLFRVEAIAADAATPEVRFEGDLSRFDGIGWKFAGGRLTIDGDVGHYVGASMSDGDIDVHGRAGLFAGCAMSGGRLTVRGDVDDFAAGSFVGAMEGMRGGTLVVRGNAGARFGDRMRRGLALVEGSTGPFAGSRMVAGTIAIGVRAGEHVGYAMRRGTVVFAGDAPVPDTTFVAPASEPGVVWQLLARDLQRFGGPFANLAGRRAHRYVGDLAANGTGELLIAR